MLSLILIPAVLLPVTMKTCTSAADNPVSEIDLLVIIPDKWGANTFFDMDDYLRAGWNVTYAGLTNPVVPCSGFRYLSGVVDFPVDILIDSGIDPLDYDAIVIGPATSGTGPDPYGTLIDSPETVTLLQGAAAAETFVWSTCAGLRVFAAADIINGRQVIGNNRFTDEYAAAGAIYLGSDHPPVKDGPVLTTVRGMYYHHHLNDFIARAVEQSGATGSGLLPRGLLPVSTESVAWEGAAWAKAIGTEASEDVRDIQAVGDDGMIMAGFTWTGHMGDALLIRTGPDGTVRWARTFGGDGSEYANSVCLTPAGGFLMAGFATSVNTDGNRDVLLICTDSGGNHLWSKTIGGAGLDVAHCIRPVGTGGYILCGQTESEGHGEDDVYVIRIDGSGNVLWSRTFGADRAEVGRSVCALADGGFLVAGANGSDDTMSHGNMDYYLIRLDTNGNELWWKTYGNDTGEGFDFCYSAIPTSDGGFLMTGSSDSDFPLEALHIKTGSDGSEEWGVSEGGDFYDYGTAVMETGDGYVITAMTREADDWNNNLLVIRTDFAGATTWSVTLGGADHEWINAMCMGPDGSIIVAGQTSSTGAGKSDVLVARIDLDGNGTPATRIRMPSAIFTAGDPFGIETVIWNPSLTPMTGVPLFVLLDVYGEYFFWPGWSRTADYRTVALQPGANAIEIIPEFAWPAGAGSAEGIGLYAAMTDAAMTELYGSLDHVTFGWY